MMIRQSIAMLLLIFLIASFSPESVSAKSTGNAPPILMDMNDLSQKHEMRKIPKEKIMDWFNQNPETDGVEGVSVNKTYSSFAMYDAFSPVVVAVIDSGVDIHHENLKGKIWKNRNEIPNNGIDDDFNGYVDDIHGWNFIGGKNGRNVEFDTFEVTREFSRYNNRIAAGEKLTAIELKYYEKVKKDYNRGRNHAKDIYDFSIYYQKKCRQKKQFLRKKIGLKNYTRTSLEGIHSKDPAINEAKYFLLEVLDTFGSYERIALFVTYYSNQLKYHYNTSYDSRSEIVKDDPNNLTETGYGNNDINATFSDHGTHVAGIIAGKRSNKRGIRGIASNVKIMILRTVPNGDERDKDIANAVRYAVNNGAKIINMSFGKSYSPHKSIVDSAFRYASRRGVLIVHAAGNDSSNNDLADHFPNRNPKSLTAKPIQAWVDVGASSFYKDRSMTAYFTNFGKKSVDIFAPGNQIMSTVPKHRYAAYSGTSMACPVFSGVAALVLSQAPFLDGEGLKALLLSTARRYPYLDVFSPLYPDQLVPFSDLSATGGIVDAYNAFKALFDK